MEPKFKFSRQKFFEAKTDGKIIIIIIIIITSMGPAALRSACALRAFGAPGYGSTALCTAPYLAACAFGAQVTGPGTCNVSREK